PVRERHRAPAHARGRARARAAGCPVRARAAARRGRAARAGAARELSPRGRVTVALDSTTTEPAPKTAALEAEARSLAETQRELQRVTRRLARARNASAVTLTLEDARTRLAAAHGGHA